MSQGGPESYIDRLVEQLIERHPLPWTIDLDWTVEMHDARGVCFLKFRTQAAADALIEHATRLDADHKKAAEETAKFLRDAGLEP